jgi:hypothetical protein
VRFSELPDIAPSRPAGALTCHAVKRTILLAVDRTALRDLLESGPL